MLRDWIRPYKGTLPYRCARRLYLAALHLFYPFGYIRNYLLFPIAGFLRVHHVPGFFGPYFFIESLKGRHAGKRCFILATGPSLRLEDVEALRGEITIGVNRIYNLYPKSMFRPTYYMALDPDVYKNMEEDHITDYPGLAQREVFFNSIVSRRIPGVCYLPLSYQNHWFRAYEPGFPHEKNLKFSDDLLFGLYDKYTVTVSAIETAIYMGCTEIYLLGTDCNYSGPDPYFFSKDAKAAENFPLDDVQKAMAQKSMMVGYRFMEQESRKRGVRIFNATRGGMLEEFERVDFDEIIKS